MHKEKIVTYTLPIERDTETLVDNILKNLGWDDEPVFSIIKIPQKSKVAYSEKA
jgi:hypothetical protein